MPGGDREPYDESARSIFEAIAANVDGTPCCTYVGADGAGHYVKMVHNGIEYADMQLIAETYDFLRQALGMTPADLASVFREWNHGDLQSYLIEITANVLAKRDGASSSALVDAIEDEAEQKGTGRWTSESAQELGVTLTGITEAVFARILSSQKADRVRALTILDGPGETGPGTADSRIVDDGSNALDATKIVDYAQGLDNIRAGSKEFGWDLDLGALATIWRGGCIIRAQFLDRIKEAYAESPHLANLMLAPFLQQALAIGRAMGSVSVEAHAVGALVMLADAQGDFASSSALGEQALDPGS